MTIDHKSKYIVNFDSKYKVKVKETEIEVEDSRIEIGCWEYDIYKMHTYHDAIWKNLGSYILYPGNNFKNWLKYVKERNSDMNDEAVLPSVGAIPLTPGEKTDGLINALKEIFGQINKMQKYHYEMVELYLDDISDLQSYKHYTLYNNQN